MCIADSLASEKKSHNVVCEQLAFLFALVTSPAATSKEGR